MSHPSKQPAQTISLPTSLGEAVGELTGTVHPVTGETIWHLQHPWGDDMVVGTIGTARAELRRIIKQNDTETETC